jgi:hypothetical protein
MRLKFYISFLIFSILVLIKFLLDPNIIVNNDLNGNIVPLLHFRESVIVNHEFPQWNSYINQGIPTLADPLYGIYNPLIGIPILLFNPEIAIKITYLLSLFAASIWMYKLLKIFKLTDRISVPLTLTYISGSYFVSRIAAGHLEKIVSYAFLPLFIYSLIKISQTKNIFWVGISSLTISFILFSGDIYNALYCLYSLVALFLFFLFKDRKISLLLVLVGLLFLLFSSIKILPMIELQNYISKIKEPFTGSMNIMTISYHLFFPFDFIFPKGILQKMTSTGFGWWESLAFIGPLSILGIYYAIKSSFLKRRSEINILLVLGVLFILLATPGSKLNPYHYIIYLIDNLQFFHVPSRILAFASILILIFLGLLLDKWKRKYLSTFLLVTNLIIVFAFSQNILNTRKFEEVNPKQEEAIRWIKSENIMNYYTVHNKLQWQIPQDKAYMNKVLLLQSNYGLYLKESLGEKHNFKGESKYDDIKPGYLISDSHLSDPDLKLTKVFGENIYVYKNSEAQPFAKVKNEPLMSNITVNKISLVAETEEKSEITLLVSKYPGWKAYVDGAETPLLNNRFLQIETNPGKHTYEFRYSSKLFLPGLLLSLTSFTIWLFYIFYNRNIVSKNRS